MYLDQETKLSSLLSKAKEIDVVADPFPHLILRNALEENLYLKLVAEMPSLTLVSKGVENNEIDLSSSNKRFNYLAKESLNDNQITPLWKKFIALHTSSAFLGEFLNIFKRYILKIYPNLEEEYGSFEVLRSGTRKIDTFDKSDVLLDALISMNTPVVTRPTSVRRAHVDLPDKLFAGLFYMRDPQDTSTGGDLEIYKFKQSRPCGFNDCQIYADCVEHVKTIKYEQNVLVLFLNSIHSLHGVTVRSSTNYPRYFVNLVGEVNKPLFDLSKYQELPHKKYLRSFKRKLKTFSCR